MAHDTAPRLAATTLIVRDAEAGLEVLMLRRSAVASFMPGAFVFPGGAVDPADALPAVQAACDETPEALCERLGADADAPVQAVAALRECFEECGLWLGAVGLADSDALPRLRAELNRAGSGAAKGLLAASRALGRPIATSALQPWSHWVTPIDLPRRFDTRFFVVRAPADQRPSVDAAETTALVWIAPAEALAQHERDELPLEFATVSTLRSLLPYRDSATLLEEAGRRRGLERRHPRMARGAGGRPCVLLPGEQAYAEVQRLDPVGRGDAQGVLQPGRAVMLGASLRRLTAPNPGMMTGPGTNTYLLGRDGRHAVLDPGPALDHHLDAIVAACAGQIEAVLVTHTHHDHSPAARRLAERCGARLIGLPAPAGSRQDHSFEPTEQPQDGEWFEVAGCRLQALRTPGHASNHVCWWLPEERLLFTGDHLMQGSTVVIDPPDGDMAAYLDSLRRLPEALPGLAWLAPGHGFLVDRPLEAIEKLIGHRLAREAKVLAALPADDAITAEALVARVYDDVGAGRHGIATRSLLAHLLKLQQDGLVQREGREEPARWRRRVVV